MAGEVSGGGGRVLLATVALVVLTAAASASAQTCSPEADTLRVFRNSLRGPGGDPPRWLDEWVTNPFPCGGGGDAPQWIGIRRCAGGHVVAIDLEGLGLEGAAPDLRILAPLQGLRSLSLAGNNLTGAFPDVSPLPALKSFFLARNNLSGEIPDGAFAALRGLQKLDLSDNAFTGRIPSSMATSGRLIDVNLSNNNFSGPVPDGLLRLGANLHVQGEFARHGICGTRKGKICSKD
ncbi:hypothetical protein HU200_042939 [Digitaria exilis]|uniref:Leucine-rich repeat-containing N-terminal plant-type domain-containing protein n=1 Tax=Digitaria exilis TaxID=1010633 RepID=A0A835B3W7_9POAL|nr:hypothetical protein HU200_042939 [Digitaria exilis]